MTPHYGPAITGIPARRKSDGPRLSVYRDIPGHNRYVFRAAGPALRPAGELDLAPLDGVGDSAVTDEQGRDRRPAEAPVPPHAIQLRARSLSSFRPGAGRRALPTAPVRPLPEPSALPSPS